MKPLLDKSELHSRLRDLTPEKYGRLYADVVSQFQEAIEILNRQVVPEDYRVSWSVPIEVAQANVVRSLFLRIQEEEIEPLKVIPVVPPLTGSVMADALAVLDSNGNGSGVNGTLMTARNYADLRKFGRDIMTVTSTADSLRAGHMGVLWGSLPLITDREAPADTVYVISLEGNDTKDISWVKLVVGSR